MRFYSPAKLSQLYHKICRRKTLFTLPFFHRARRRHKLLKKINKRVKVCNLCDDGARPILLLLASKKIYSGVLALVKRNRWIYLVWSEVCILEYLEDFVFSVPLKKKLIFHCSALLIMPSLLISMFALKPFLDVYFIFW